MHSLHKVRRATRINMIIVSSEMEINVIDLHTLSQQSRLEPQISWTFSNSRISLSPATLSQNQENNLVRLVFIAWNKLEDILQPINHPQTNTINQQTYENPKKNETKKLNSQIISVSLKKESLKTLNQPVEIYFAHLNPDRITKSLCVYWDYNIR